MKSSTLAAAVLVALLLAAVGGIAAATADAAWPLAVARAIEPIGVLWVNAIRMTVVPLVFAILVTGIASTGAATLGRVGGGALALFRRFRSLLFATLGLALYPRDAVTAPRDAAR